MASQREPQKMKVNGPKETETRGPRVAAYHLWKEVANELPMVTMEGAWKTCVGVLLYLDLETARAHLKSNRVVLSPHCNPDSIACRAPDGTLVTAVAQSASVRTGKDLLAMNFGPVRYRCPTLGTRSY